MKVISQRAYYLSVVAAYVCALVIGILNTNTVSAFDGGDGSVGSPYQILSCSELLDISNDLDADYELIGNVDCDGVVMSRIGEFGSPFTGTLDGNGHSISNVSLTSATFDSGIFGRTENATITNVYLDDITISATDNVGALVGTATYTTITHVALSSSAITGTGEYVGGIVGYLGGSSIEKSYAEDTTVTGDTYVGGLAGITIGPATLTNSYFQGTVDGDTTVGGVTGQVGAGPGYVTETYADVVFTNAGTDVVDTIASGASASSNFIASAPYLGNNTQPPLNSWDFDTVWYIRTSDYPGLRPLTMPSYLCSETSGTYTTLTAGCQIERNLGISATWELQYSETGKDIWTNLPGQSGQSFSVTVTGLEQSTRYTVRFRYATSIGSGAWQTVLGTTDGDLNGDGIADSTQDNLSGYKNSTGKHVLIDVGTGCEITTDDTVNESSLEVQDSGFDYSNGLFEFAGDCGTPGFTTTVKLYYYDVNKAGSTFRKYNPNTKAYFNLTGTYGALIDEMVINGRTVTVVSYQISDGGDLDTDQLVNGEFEDPAGLASSVVGAPNTGLARVQ